METLLAAVYRHFLQSLDHLVESRSTPAVVLDRTLDRAAHELAALHAAMDQHSSKLAEVTTWARNTRA